MHLTNITDLREYDVHEIWRLATRPLPEVGGTAAWSFEGNGIRTRTSFLLSFRQLGLDHIELPNLLKGDERLQDISQYLSPFYDVFVIRDSNHAAICKFAEVSTKPVINAMSQAGHPCEVLTDAFFLNKHFGSIRNIRIALWGPPSNVFNSWHDLAKVLGLAIDHVCDPLYFGNLNHHVRYVDRLEGRYDVVVTDSWSSKIGPQSKQWSLTESLLLDAGEPLLLPTPPFSIGKELAFDPARYARFSGYAQKALLVSVQSAILWHMLQVSR